MNAIAKPQFTLKTIMIAMAVVCLGCAVVFAFPPILQRMVYGTVELAFVGMIAALVIYGKESIRAFGIGAALSMLHIRVFGGSAWPRSAGNYWDGSALSYSFFVFVLVISATICGFACVASRNCILAYRQSASGSSAATRKKNSVPPVQQPTEQ